MCVCVYVWKYKKWATVARPLHIEYQKGYGLKCQWCRLLQCLCHGCFFSKSSPSACILVTKSKSKSLNTQNIQEKFPVSKLPPSCHGTVWSIVSGSYFLISNFPSWNDFPKILFTMGELIFWKSLTLLEGSNFSKTNLTSPRTGHRKGNLVEKSTWSQLFQVNFSCIFWV